MSHAQHPVGESGVEVQISRVALNQFDECTARHGDGDLAVEPLEKCNDEPFAPPVEERLSVVGTAEETAGGVLDPSHGRRPSALARLEFLSERTVRGHHLILGG